MLQDQMARIADKRPTRPTELAGGVVILVASLWCSILIAAPALKALAAQCMAVFAQPGNYSVWISSPGTGEEVLPDEARSMLELLRRNGVSEFRYADWPPDAVVPDEYREYTRQRVTEGAYPIMRSEKAAHLISPSARSIPDSCQILELIDNAVLAYCP